jgi:hypothetical protein
VRKEYKDNQELLVIEVFLGTLVIPVRKGSLGHLVQWDLLDKKVLSDQEEHKERKEK